MVVETKTTQGVLVVTLNRPQALNAFTVEVHAQLAQALEQATEPEVGAVVITGAGRGFCVGQDLNEATDQTSDIGGHLRRAYHPNILAIRRLEKPVIAAINGPCAGAGLSLASACDIRLASGEASFTPAFSSIGLVPDSGGSYFLVRLLGYARAFEWLASSKRLSAQEARDMGLVSRVIDPEHLLDEAVSSAAALAAMPRRAIGLTKLLLEQGLTADLETQLETEADFQSAASSQPEFAELIDAFLHRQRS